MGLDFLGSDRPVVLAPLVGYSVRPFRRICLEHGAAAVWSGMVSADGLVRGERGTAEAASFDEEERPIGLQLFGSTPEVLAEATAILSEKGPDFIDLNAGCPVKKVCRRNGGAALLKDPDLLGRIVEAMVGASRVPVTAKIRAGWNADDCNPRELARVVEQAGARAVSVHARTRSEKFLGRARWDLIREVVAGVSIPVVGNGDVVSPEDVERMFAETGCAAVMVGRGAIGNPWLFTRANARLQRGEDLPPPTAAERAEICLRHAEEAVSGNDEVLAMREFRKFVARYTRGVRGSHRLRRHLPEMTTLERLRAALEELVADEADETEQEPGKVE